MVLLIVFVVLHIAYEGVLRNQSALGTMDMAIKQPFITWYKPLASESSHTLPDEAGTSHRGDRTYNPYVQQLVLHQLNHLNWVGRVQLGTMDCVFIIHPPTALLDPSPVLPSRPMTSAALAESQSALWMCLVWVGSRGSRQSSARGSLL